MSLHKNMRCNINLIGMAGSCEDYFILFLKSLIERDPAKRCSAEEALSYEIFQKEIYNEVDSQILSSKFKKLLPHRILPQSKAHYDELHSYRNFEDKITGSKSLNRALSRYSRNFSERHITSKGNVSKQETSGPTESNFVFDISNDQH